MLFRTFKTSFLALMAGLALSGVPAIAEDKPKDAEKSAPLTTSTHDETPEQRRVRMLKNYEDVLTDLTPEQKTKLLAVLEPTSDAIRAARKDDKLTEKQYHDLVIKIHADAATKVDAILTEPQRAKWSVSREEKRKEREKARKEREAKNKE